MREFIQEAFSNILEKSTVAENVFEQYFSKDYVQCVDGKKLNYDDFVQHIKTLKSVMKTMNVSFKQMVVEEDWIATLHIVDGVKHSNEAIQVQVNAFMKIREGKIVWCDELTYLIKGEHNDKDLGSCI